MEFNHKVAIVTGGATGIGRAITTALSDAGYAVVINYNTSSQAADEVVQSILQKGGHALALQANISNSDQCTQLVNQVMNQFGRIDVLVNNAGITADNLIIRMNEDQFDQVINTNLKGVWTMCKLVTRPMMKASTGRIINISSVSGLLGLAGQTNYSAAKAGVIGLTKALAREVATRHITVNAIAPGYIETAMTAKLPTEIQDAALKAIPVGRFGQPDDIASAVVFLASDSASYITGQVLAVDGGMAMQ